MKGRQKYIYFKWSNLRYKWDFWEFVSAEEKLSIKCKYCYLVSLSLFLRSFSAIWVLFHHLTWLCNKIHYQVRWCKVLKLRWNLVKTKTTTPGNNIYTLWIAFFAFSSFILSKFQTLYFPYKLSYYAWATCELTIHKLASLAEGFSKHPHTLTIFEVNTLLNI